MIELLPTVTTNCCVNDYIGPCDRLLVLRLMFLSKTVLKNVHLPLSALSFQPGTLQLCHRAGNPLQRIGLTRQVRGRLTVFAAQLVEIRNAPTLPQKRSPAIMFPYRVNLTPVRFWLYEICFSARRVSGDLHGCTYVLQIVVFTTRGPAHLQFLTLCASFGMIVVA